MIVSGDNFGRSAAMPPTGWRGAHVFSFDLNDGGRLDLAACAGGPVLIVNTASRCGFTGQYEGLEHLHRDFGPRGLTVIAVPSNDFADQEPGDDAAIRDFCGVRYGVTFPVTRKIRVAGRGAHPFYRWVRREAGWFGRRPWWNFHKYLIGPDGMLVDWFAPMTKPADPALTRRLEHLLPR
ncbi:glutathione peroxidase [Marivibrio halodurans]|uniref:Glutathione peroxidase n=1 Tax=Marivibrio halodurans TaxID=2039722 RepID=A0A8J7S120_9PROT|nr:glutathione peroxidase [Marivibrio halodurans]MBP5856739.1 glutathione peroxidase [Marivibrio halodurans]